MNVKYIPKHEDAGTLSFGQHKLDVKQIGRDQYEATHVPTQWNIIAKAERIGLQEKRLWPAEGVPSEQTLR